MAVLVVQEQLQLRTLIEERDPPGVGSAQVQCAWDQASPRSLILGIRKRVEKKVDPVSTSVLPHQSDSYLSHIHIQPHFSIGGWGLDVLVSQ